MSCRGNMSALTMSLLALCMLVLSAPATASVVYPGIDTHAGLHKAAVSVLTDAPDLNAAEDEFLQWMERRKRAARVRLEHDRQVLRNLVAQLEAESRSLRKSRGPTPVPTVRPTQPPRGPDLPPLGNVLFVMVDDLRTSLGAYGDPVAITPNFDRLIARGVRFDNMHVSKTECAPSRSSMLAGLRNDEIRVWDFEPTFRKKNPFTPTLPGFLRDQGYYSISVGKTHDERSFGQIGSLKRPDICRTATGTGRKGWACSWDEYMHRFFAKSDFTVCNRGTGAYPERPGKPKVVGETLTYSGSCNETLFDDYCHVLHTIKYMKQLAENPARPWFLAVGFWKPHMPWTAPCQDFDLYADHNRLMQELLPKGIPRNFWSKESSHASKYNNDEIRSYKAWKGTSAPRRIQGYYATVSLVDHQIGRLLDEFDKLPKDVRENTHILLWSDHGFHLGDRGLWGKKTLFEITTRVPFAIVPSQRWKLYMSRELGVNIKTNTHVRAPTDSVDIFPTVLDMLGFNSAPLGLSGASLVPLLIDPSSSVRAAAVTQYQSYQRNGVMGYSIRTTRFRLTAFVNFPPRCRSKSCNMSYRPGKGKYELWDYGVDTDGFERLNYWSDPRYANVRSMMVELFREHASKSWGTLRGVEPFDLNGVDLLPAPNGRELGVLEYEDDERVSEEVGVEEW